MNITNERIDGLLGNGIVLSWADLCGQTIGEDHLSSCLGQNSNEKDHVCSLEGISKNIEITGNENEDDRGCICDSRGSRVLP